MTQKTFRVQTIIEIMDQIAPPQLAGEWDRIGLQVGRPCDLVGSVLLALDFNGAVLALARTMDRPLIICHHPAIFNPLNDLRMDNPQVELLVQLAAGGYSLLAAHTNLDLAPGGVADSLASAVSTALKIKQGPPYGRPIADFGRLLILTKERRLSDIWPLIVTQLAGAPVQLNVDQDRTVTKLAVFPGSFPEEALPGLLAARVDAIVCGECKYHNMLALEQAGIAAIVVGHDVSERVVLGPLAERLKQQLGDLPIAVYTGLNYNNDVFRVNRAAAGVS